MRVCTLRFKCERVAKRVCVLILGLGLKRLLYESVCTSRFGVKGLLRECVYLEVWCEGCYERVYLEVWCEGVGEPHVAREGTEDEVPHLDAVGRDHVAEGEVVVTEELREVMEQYQ